MVRMADRLTFTKGHGTENDFVLVPDLDGALGLTAAHAAALADRRAGIGGDGVIRVVPADLADDPAVRAQAGAARWFMDYRNADGSLSEMCGNGTRVFAAVPAPRGAGDGDAFAIATRAGVKQCASTATGSPSTSARGGSPTRDRRARRLRRPGAPRRRRRPRARRCASTSATRTPSWRCPQAVDLDEPRPHPRPRVRPEPEHGTNVELVRPMGPGHIAMRVHERGVGETRSCGTGACAAAIATQLLGRGPRHRGHLAGRRARRPAHRAAAARPRRRAGRARPCWSPTARIDLAGAQRPQRRPDVAADELDEALEVRLVLGGLEHHARGADLARGGARHPPRSCVAGHTAAGGAVGAVPAGSSSASRCSAPGPGRGHQVDDDRHPAAGRPTTPTRPACAAATESASSASEVHRPDEDAVAHPPGELERARARCRRRAAGCRAPAASPAAPGRG